MKILFINQIDNKGGAAIAAWRIAECLEKYFNTENHFLVASKCSDNINVYNCTPVSKNQRIIDEYLLKITNLFGLQYIFIPFHKKAIIEIVERIKPDIINLNNIHGSYFEVGLLNKLSKYCPIVWTLHDMWSFTRNAAYTFGNEAWNEMKSFREEKDMYPRIGFNTGNYLLKRKRKIYQGSDLSIIGPSKWMFHMALKSPVFQNKEIIHLPYAINLEKYLPLDKSISKMEFGIDPNSNVLFFNTDWIRNEPRKGGDKILRILNELNKRLQRKVTLLLTGSEIIVEFNVFENFFVKHLGRVYNEEKLIKIFNASDLIIHPSISDNLPNILIESMACGTPAVAFNVGGTSDIVIHEYNGYLVEPFNIIEYSERIHDLINDREKLKCFSINARVHAEKNFNSKNIAESYYSFFSKIIRNKLGMDING